MPNELSDFLIEKGGDFQLERDLSHNGINKLDPPFCSSINM